MEPITTTRRKTPKYIWPLILSPFILFGVACWQFKALDAALCGCGFYVCLLLFLAPFGLMFLFLHKYNLLSLKDMTITLDDEGVTVKDGDDKKHYKWEEINSMNVVEQLTPAGHYKYLRIRLIRQVFDKRRNAYRNFYPTVNIFYYGFDKDIMKELPR